MLSITMINVPREIAFSPLAVEMKSLDVARCVCLVVIIAGVDHGERDHFSVQGCKLISVIITTAAD